MQRPSEYLRKHLDGGGNGFELDDLISRHAGEAAYEDVIDEVYALMVRHHDQALTAPSARAELLRLADRLANEGR
jgi:hypothetical protein